VTTCTSSQHGSRCHGQRRLGRTYQLEVADVAGEQLAEFVPGEKQYAAKGSYYQYVLDSDALFLFIDYPAVDPHYGPPAAPLPRQVDNLIFVIQAMAD
jgi:hypothetical protein